MAVVSDVGLRANTKPAAQHGRSGRCADIFVVCQFATTRRKYSSIEQLQAEVRHPLRGGAATADDGADDDDDGDDANADVLAPLSDQDTPAAAAAKMSQVLSKLADDHHLQMSHLRGAVRSSTTADNPASLSLLLARAASTNPAVEAALVGDRACAVVTFQPAHLATGRAVTKHRLGIATTWRGKYLASMPLNNPATLGARGHPREVRRVAEPPARAPLNTRPAGLSSVARVVPGSDRATMPRGRKTSKADGAT